MYVCIVANVRLAQKYTLVNFAELANAANKIGMI
jgi:hypothetical protein